MRRTGAILAALALSPRAALASEGSAEGDSMGLVLVLLAFVGTAYLLTHFVLDRLQRRFLLVSGLEYVLLGALLGASTGVLDDTASLAPIIAFAAGWIGLVHGTAQDLQRLQDSRRWSLRLAVTDLLITGAAVTLLSYEALHSALGFDVGTALPVAAAVGCASVSGSTSASELVRSRYASARSGLLPVLARAARLSELLAILAFGVVLSVFHEASPGAAFRPGPSDWVLLTLGLGAALGALFSGFLGEDHSENSRFLAMVGIICLATGAAFFLEISALAVNLVLGLVLANTSAGQGLHAVFERTRKPVMLLLLVFAGVLWRPVPWADGLLFTGIVVLGRVAARGASTWLASIGTPLRGDLARGALSQGEVALAIALSVKLVWSGEAVDLAFTAILASTLLSELAAPRLLKGLLVDAGEIRQDIEIDMPADAPAGGG